MSKMTKEEFDRSMSAVEQLIKQMAALYADTHGDEYGGDREFYLLYGRIDQMVDTHFIDEDCVEELRDRISTIEKVAMSGCDYSLDMQAFVTRLRWFLSRGGSDEQ